MLKTGIVVLIATVVACYSPYLIDRFWVSFLPVSLFISLVNPRIRLTGLFMSCFLWTTAVIYWQLDHRLNSDMNNKRVVAVGEVINIPKTSPTSTNFLFKPVSIEGYNSHYPQKIRLNWRNAPETLKPGQFWQLQIKLKQPHGFQNPGGFDYERWMFVRGIQARGYVLDSELNELQKTTWFSLNSLRNHLKKHIEKSCLGCNHIGLIEALAIGFRGDISMQTRNLLSQTGTAHLIAVSGLHIGIVSTAFYYMGLLLWSKLLYAGRLKRKEIALLLAWFGGLSYSLLSGFDLPAQRAMIMLTVVLFSLYVRSPFNLLNSIASALVIVLLIFPLAVLSESFWLTFSALMIISFGSFLLQLQTSRLKQLVIIQILFSVLFIPLSVYIFGQIHVASMAANLIAVPFISFIIVPFNFVLLLFFWLPDQLLQLMYRFLDNMLNVLIQYLEWLQDNGLAAIQVADIEGWKLILLLILTVLLLMPRGFVSRAVILFLLPPVFLWNLHPLSAAQFKMTVLDVGMGTSVVIQTHNHSLIYDFGPGNRQGFSLGKWVVLPYMFSEGIDAPDRIVLSHADQDHSGGFYAVQESYQNIPVFSGTPFEVKRSFPNLKYIRNCHDTMSWMWDGVKFEFIGNQPVQSSKNNRSCVLKISINNKSVLLAGDIEHERESQLVKETKNNLRSTFLVVPHHGSDRSSSKEFIASVSAHYILFTTGYLNMWHFPRQEIVQRYKKTGANTLQTDKTGAIQIICSSDKCEIEKFRSKHPRVWY